MIIAAAVGVHVAMLQIWGGWSCVRGKRRRNPELDLNRPIDSKNIRAGPIIRSLDAPVRLQNGTV